MTEFNLTNGQAIELTKDGILIKGNYIEIDGNVTVIKGDKFATVMEHGDKQGKISYVPIDDEPKIMEPATNYNSENGRLVQLESKLSTAITEIDKLKTAIKSERALTHNLINDAIIKAKITNGK